MRDTHIAGKIHAIFISRPFCSWLSS